MARTFMIIGGRAADACPSNRDEAIAAFLVKRILTVAQGVASSRSIGERSDSPALDAGDAIKVASCLDARRFGIAVWTRLHRKPFGCL